MSPPAPGPRLAGAAAAVALLGGLLWPVGGDPSPPRPDVVVVLTDDQHGDTLRLMPWLSGELDRPGSGWGSHPAAFANTPLCCPARASLLTGRYASHTGVLRNEDGARLDESSTLATWLRGAGYRTGMFGKYLNRYPFGRPPYVPSGWDRFVAKRNRSDATVYRDFDAIDQGSPVHVSDAYATDWLAERAVDFVRTTPGTRPLFLLFSPSAPHEPWVPADRHAGEYEDLRLDEPPNVAGALRGAPPWVRSLPAPSAAQRAAWLDERRRAAETLLAVDDALRSIVDALGERLDETLILVLSDHGYSFGEHRWQGKKCPYEACVRIPLAMHLPERQRPGSHGDPPPIVSTVDLAATILGYAGVTADVAMDGRGFGPWGVTGEPGEHGPPSGSSVRAVYLEWAGDREIPAWTAVRTPDMKLIRYADGFEELYDLGGRLRPPDPWETINRIDDPAYAGLAEDLRALLGRVEADG